MCSVCFIIIYTLYLFSQQVLISGYSLTPSQSISDGQALISQGGTFELGFFSPSGSTKRYVGIWYNTIPSPPVVWVANRDSPLNDTSGVLKIDTTGNIVVVNRTQGVLWSSNSSLVLGTPIVELLESGNLVLRDGRNRDLSSYIWQSFDYPGDTFLPGMKLGWNLKTGLNRYMSSWKNNSDPSHGDLTYQVDLTGYLDLFIRNGSDMYSRIRPWNAVRASDAPDMNPGSFFTYTYVISSEEIYFIYEVVNQSVIMRVILTQTSTEGVLKHLTWVERTNSWVNILSIPRDRCDAYALCGSYGFCDTTSVPICQCLKGCKPKSQQEWSVTDWSKGCEREVPVNCSKGEGFMKYSGVKLPDTTGSFVNSTMNLEECRQKCLNNCSCTAYSNSDVSGRNIGCIIWVTDLVDIRQLNDGGQDLYVRMAASALDTKRDSGTKKRVIMIVSFTCITSIILLIIVSWWIRKKTFPKVCFSQSGGSYSRREDLELPVFDLITISNATNGFSYQNKLGEGGFGPVYKGNLEDGQEIAVKRLSTESTQGTQEFKNEVLLISKLQHKNLVRLLGCCIQGKERMLVYEYMQNKSLDSFIFDKSKSRLLDWNKRFKIIDGIARGLLYLHHDSRLRIIHRDLKASNILLDNEMVPKISDFGLARIFRGDQFEAETKRVVGTYGYMAPEYAVDGHFSVKSDVFSFGVLVLEIISGKKNRGFVHVDHALNLLGHAWRLWSEDKSMELVDNSVGDLRISEDVLRCIHIGLLCVQKVSEQRPTMSVVVSMLSSEDVILPTPQEPGFYIERSSLIKETESVSSISNDVTVTMLQGR